MVQEELFALLEDDRRQGLRFPIVAVIWERRFGQHAGEPAITAMFAFRIA